MAVALNSAVPDFGSVLLMVRMFVSTSSGKCSVMKASPGRSAWSTRTGASTAPLREVMRTRSPSVTPSSAASVVDSSSSSGRRSGEV